MCPHRRAVWHHLANTIEPSICCGDTALCQITLTICSKCYTSSLPVYLALLMVGMVLAESGCLSKIISSQSASLSKPYWEQQQQQQQPV